MMMMEMINVLVDLIYLYVCVYECGSRVVYVSRSKRERERSRKDKTKAGNRTENNTVLHLSFSLTPARVKCLLTCTILICYDL